MVRFSILLVLVLACGEEQTASNETAETPTQPEPETMAPTPAPTPPEPSAAESEAGPSASDESFTLEARAQDSGYTNGALGQFGIHLSGRGEWHINEEFPFSVSLEAPGEVGLAKAQLGKTDAAEFGESAARLDVPFTPSQAGEHRVTARVNFAMCNPQSCVPKTETIALNLAVTPQS